MTEHESLAAALVAFQARLSKVGKSKTATVPTKAGGSYSYKYADLVDVTAQIVPALVEHGLAFVCLPRLAPNGKYELVGTLTHGASGEQMEGSLPLTGGTEQALGSSLTYLRRYLLGCMTGVVTDEDEDGTAATHADRDAEAARDRAEAERVATHVLSSLGDATTEQEVRALGSQAHKAGVLGHPAGEWFPQCQTVNDAVAARMAEVTPASDAGASA